MMYMAKLVTPYFFVLRILSHKKKKSNSFLDAIICLLIIIIFPECNEALSSFLDAFLDYLRLLSLKKKICPIFISEIHL